MDIKVKLKPTSVIKARLGIQKGGPAHAFFTESCYRYMGQFVPGGTKGTLNQNVDLEVSKITYKSPYSHYQYIGKLYVDPKYQKGAFYSEDYGYWSRPGISKISTAIPLNYHTLGTGSFWDKKMWSSKGEKVIEEVQKYVDRGCK